MPNFEYKLIFRVKDFVQFETSINFNLEMIQNLMTIQNV